MLVKKNRLTTCEGQLEQARITIQDQEETIARLFGLILADCKNNSVNIHKSIDLVASASSDASIATSAGFNEIELCIEQSNDLVTGVFSYTESSEERSNSALASSQALEESIKTLSSQKDKLHEIDDLVSSIESKANEIVDIGKQAELLSLNASIEAARAGEHGRGFAIVAGELKKLAMQSQEMSFEISNTISDGSSKIHNITGEMTRCTENLVVNSERMSEDIRTLVTETHSINGAMNKLSTQFKTASNFIGSTAGNIISKMESLIGNIARMSNNLSGIQIIDLVPQEAVKRLADFDYIIDVRSPDEFNGELGHIPNSKLLTLQTEFPDALPQFDKSKSYLFVCRSGGRSTKAAQHAALHGLPKIYNLQGGMMKWPENAPRNITA